MGKGKVVCGVGGMTHNATDAVLTADLVQQSEKLNGIGGCLLRGDDLHGNALVEVDGDVEGSIRGLQGGDSLGPHVLRGGHIGVLKDASLYFVSAAWN